MDLNKGDKMDFKVLLPVIVMLMDDAAFPAVQRLAAMIPDPDLKDLVMGLLPVIKIYADKKAAKIV